MAVSIVDYLKKKGQDSSYAARKQLAEQYGISNYSGTAAQNMNLLAQLEGGVGGGQKAPTGTGPQVSANVLKGTNGESIPKAPTMTMANSGVKVPNSPHTATVAGSSSSGTFAGSGPKKSQETTNYYNQLQAHEKRKPGDYEESKRVEDYYDRLQDLEANKPDEFKSQYEEEIDSILDSILNNKDFSYGAEDLANDELYQMYRENYIRQGNQAMRDVMGNVAASTGGYGSTYAAAAGQQAYDEYLTGLNDRALEFADRAYQQYLNEQQNRYNQMNVVTGLDSIDYDRYRDTVGDYYNDLSYLAGRYDSERNFDYGQYRDLVGDYYNDLTYLANRYDAEYGKDWNLYQSGLQNQQWAKEFAFQQAQAAQDQANFEAQMAFEREQYEYAKAKAQASGGGGGSRRSSGSSKRSSKKTSSSGSSKTTELGGYAPLSAKLGDQLQNGEISDYDAMETIMQEMEKGNLSVDEAYMAAQMAGVDTEAAIQEEAKKNIQINNLADFYKRKK